MTWTTRILGFVAIIVAFVMWYLAAQAYYARTNWIQTLENLARQRDGELKIANDGTAADDVLKGLPEDKVDFIKNTLKLKSSPARRKAAGESEFQGFQTDKNKVIVDSTNAKELIKKYGARDYHTLLRDFVQDQTPRLRDEEQEVAARKATLVTIREEYKKQIELLQSEIAQLKIDQTAEKALTDRVLAENADRRQELVRLYAEVEEGLAARNLEQSKEQDLRDQLEYMRAKLKRVADENQKLAEQIRQRETQ